MGKCHNIYKFTKYKIRFLSSSFSFLPFPLGEGFGGEAGVLSIAKLHKLNDFRNFFHYFFPLSTPNYELFLNFAPMKAIVDDKIPYIQGQIEQLVDEVCYLPGSQISAADVRDADILVVRTRTHCNRSLLQGSQVRLIITATIGYDHLDTTYLQEAGIRWTNCPGCNASSVCQYVHNALLAIGILPTSPAEPLVAGVVGVGHVGSRVAADLQAAGVNVLLCDPPRARKEKDFCHVPLEELAKRCDIITFHTPLNREGADATYHLGDAAFFRSLRRQPVIINSSRGEVIDNTALVQALDNGRVRAAIIDTWENEPHINSDLLERAVIATPHIAGYSADGKVNATRMSLQAIAEFLHKPFTLNIQPPTLPSNYQYGAVSEGPLRLYDPRVDTQHLKNHPTSFEHLRGNYPLRREHQD